MTNYKLETLENVGGIFYENLGYAKFHIASLKLLTYINITNYDNRLNFINQTFTSSILLCNNMNSEDDHYYCKQSLNFLEVQIPNLYFKFNSIKAIIGHERVKRGWFDGIQKTLHSM